MMLIDGNSLINRAFYGLNNRNPLTAPDGTPTGAIYAFLNMMLKYLEEVKPGYVCVAFDLKEETFRHKMFDEYKSNRKQMPEELAVQIPILKELLDVIGIPRFEIEGFEADDIIGTLSHESAKKGYDVCIVTGDKDSFQLIDSSVYVLQPLTRSGQSDTQLVDVEAIYDRYKVSPAQLIDIKAIMGDPSDNIPGVKGIGEKGAVTLISRYGSLDKVYENLNELAPATAAKLEKDREMAYLSRELSKINLDVPTSLKPENLLVREPDKKKLSELFHQYGFKSLFSRFGLDYSPDDSNHDSNDRIKHNDKKLICIRTDEFLDQLAQNENMIFTPTGENIRFRLSACQRNDGLIVSDQTHICFFSSDLVKQFWDVILKLGSDRYSLGSYRLGLVFFDYKAFLKTYGLPPSYIPPHDIMTAGYLLNQIDGKPDFARLYQSVTGNVFQDSGLKQVQTQLSLDMAETNANIMNPDAKDEERADIKKIDETDQRYTDAYFNIANIQAAKLAGLNRLDSLMYELEMPLTGILAKMEQKGFALDQQELERLSDSMAQEQDQLQSKIFKMCKKEFNLNSPKQLGQVLFDHLALPAGKKRSGGNYSTDAEELSRLYNEHPVIPLILSYRQVSKLKSTFVDGLKRQINPNDGRVHTTFSQVQTSTGRLSSSEPNLQNIPIRSEAGARIRRVFIASENNVLLDADYSQIELRLLAHLSQDPAMIEAFSLGQDIHLNTACSIFNLSAGEITPEQRSIAKTVNFSIVYGISDFGLSRDLGIPVKTAHKYIEGYNKRYPLVRNYLESLVAFAHEHGYVETMFGRRRYLPELKSGNRNIRQFGERAAMNAPVQGTAADLIKKAMVLTDRRLLENGLNGQIILQVHDELILEVPSDESEPTAVILRDCMENAISISVPLLAEVHKGNCWADCK
jgi:DNA polymerase-1